MKILIIISILLFLSCKEEESPNINNDYLKESTDFNNPLNRESITNSSKED